MKSENQAHTRSLRDIELEVEAEGREWTRRRLEEKLQQEADATAGFFPLSQRKVHHRRQEVMPLRTAVGVVKVKVWYGKDPASKQWGCPMRQRWGLRPISINLAFGEDSANLRQLHRAFGPPRAQ